MVKLRLRRMGSKRRPVYDIVAADGRYPRDGRFIEKIGQYNPVVNAQEIVLKRDRALYWLSNGAQPTDTVNSILRKEGVIMEYYLSRKGNSPEKIAEELASHKLRQDRKKTSRDKPNKVVAAPTAAPVAESPVVEEVVAPITEAPAVEEVVAPITETTAVEEVVAPITEAPAVEEVVAPITEAQAVEEVVAPITQAQAVEEVVASQGEAPTQEA